jgi:hypothetical protein
MRWSGRLVRHNDEKGVSQELESNPPRHDGILHPQMGPSDDEFVLSITPDVMACLIRSAYFTKLDDVLCPEDGSTSRQSCDGSFGISESIFLASGFDLADIDDILAVLKSKGACCDCEVLYNVAETNRFKAKYWRNRAAALTNGLHSLKHPQN